MSISYKWSIVDTNRLTADGFITTVHWTCNAVDGTYTAGSYGTCSWSEGTPKIPYANVTMQNVLDWCFASFVDKDAIEASLAANIALQKNPVTATGVPW